MTRGRPLRFLALVLGGWVAVRLAVLWPGGVASVAPAVAEPGRSPARVAHGASGVVARLLPPRLPGGPRATEGQHQGPVSKMLVARVDPPSRRPAQLDPGLRRGGERDGITVEPIEPGAGTTSAAAQPPARQAHLDPHPSAGASLPPPAPLSATATLSSRWHGDLYLIARPSGGDGLAFGQLGASQGGARITYALGEARRLALSARVSTPLRGTGREAALGIDVQPTRLPVHLLAEQRLPLDGGQARPALQLIGGGVVHLPLRLIAEGYAQAGAVHRRGGFADGSVRLTRRLLGRRGFAVDLGAGAWGAAQRGVARLDTGPTLGLTLPAPGRTVRLAVDYRLRVAGRARPGSGPAVSLGSSF